MNVHIEMADPATLDQATLNEICELAAAGFGRINDEAMRNDTMNHVRGAESLQLARAKDGRLSAFAMYGKSLWRAGN
jgi:hypothetical protein